VFAASDHVSVLPGAATRQNGIAREQAGLGILVIIVAGLLAFPAVRKHVTASSDGSLIMTAVAVAIGVASAVLLDIAGRLTLHRRAVWISAALALYSVTVVPFTTVGTIFERVGLTTPSLLVAEWIVIGLLALAIRPPRIVGGSAGWALAGFGLILTLATGEVAQLPHSTLARAAPAATVCSLAAVLIVNTFLERNGSLRPIGLGLLMIAATHLYGIAVSVPTSEPKLAFLTSRLFGLVLVLSASVQLTQRAWRELRAKCDEQQTELEVQATHLKRMACETAERNHELRNGLASLAQAHRLLDESPDADDAAQLGRAATSELSRLEAMLEISHADARPAGYPVAPILVDLVALHQSAGHDVELEVDERLRASGLPEVLAQVVTNLLVNCERHASGSQVRIRASGDQDRVLIEVADSGPGVPPELRQVVMERGVRCGRTGGSGLGLHICAKLLNAQGGALRMLDSRSGDTGCTMLVELPSVLDDPRST
jgi:two-component system, OmpR family, sensor kinase